jgi:hypothetical protein
MIIKCKRKQEKQKKMEYDVSMPAPKEYSVVQYSLAYYRTALSSGVADTNIVTRFDVCSSF